MRVQIIGHGHTWESAKSRFMKFVHPSSSKGGKKEKAKKGKIASYNA